MIPNEQQNLILDFDDSCVVIAAPGSGKTFVLSHKIKRNLKQLIDFQGVIAISYTNKASNELKNRSLSGGIDPLSSFFGTIDKFDISEIIIPFGKHLFGIPTKDIDIVKIDTLSQRRQAQLAWVDSDFRSEDLTDEYINLLKGYFLNGIILIETLGFLATYIFSNSLACRNYIKARYKYLYVDEYQDAGYEQHELFIKIQSLGIKAIAVGDLNQSIFAFSGKDPQYLRDLTSDKRFKFFKLDKNHRCHPSIINYSNHLLNEKTELIPTEESVVFFKRIEGDEKSLTAFVDKTIPSIVKKFNIQSNSKIAILTKSNRTLNLYNGLLQIPHKLSLNTDLDMNLNIWSSIFSSLLRFYFDESFPFIDVIELFVPFDKVSKSDLQKLYASKNFLRNLKVQNAWSTETIRLEFLKIAQIIAPNSRNMKSLNLLDETLEDSNLLKTYEPANPNEVNLLTLHKSKGLEYDFVIHLDLYEWILPKKIVNDGDFNNPIYSEWQQDINLHYVGITRAKNGCLLLSSTKRQNATNKVVSAKDSEFLTLNQLPDLRYNPKDKRR